MIQFDQRATTRTSGRQTAGLPAAGLAWIALAVVAAGGAAEEKRATERPAETTATPAAARPSEVSIEDAKRQFEHLKSARDAAGQPKAGLPRISTPELHSAPAEALPRSLKTPKSESETKTGNWLVDAMEKGRDERKSGDRAERGRGSDDDRRDPANSRDKERSGDAAEPERTGETKREMAGVNPLAPYLSQWMTAQDYALLGAGIQKTADGAESVGRAGSSGPSPVPGLTGGVAITDIVRPAASAKPAINAPPAENPYLQLLNAPPAAPTPATASPVFVMPAARTPASTYTPPPAPPAPKPNVPDFLKPQSEEKYFKPLKRF